MEWKLLEVTNETGKWVRPVIRGTDVILLAYRIFSSWGWHQTKMKICRGAGTCHGRGWSAVTRAGLPVSSPFRVSEPPAHMHSLTGSAAQDASSSNMAQIYSSQKEHDILNFSVTHREAGGDVRRALVITLRIKRWGFLGPVFLFPWIWSLSGCWIQ